MTPPSMWSCQGNKIHSSFHETPRTNLPHPWPCLTCYTPPARRGPAWFPVLASPPMVCHQRVECKASLAFRWATRSYHAVVSCNTLEIPVTRVPIPCRDEIRDIQSCTSQKYIWPFNSSMVQFHLPADPRQWGSSLYADAKEPDDDLHNPDVKDPKSWSRFADRGIVNVGCLFIIIISLVTLL